MSRATLLKQLGPDGKPVYRLEGGVLIANTPAPPPAPKKKAKKP